MNENPTLPQNKLVWETDMKPLAALKAGFRTLLPNCRQVSRLQSDLLGQPLSLPKRVGLTLHLLACKWCRRYGKQVGFLRQAPHEEAEKLNETAPRTLSPEARERLRKSLRREIE